MRGIERNGNGPNGARTGAARAILVPQPKQKVSQKCEPADLIGTDNCFFIEHLNLGQKIPWRDVAP